MNFLNALDMVQYTELHESSPMWDIEMCLRVFHLRKKNILFGINWLYVYFCLLAPGPKWWSITLKFIVLFWRNFTFNLEFTIVKYFWAIRNSVTKSISCDASVSEFTWAIVMRHEIDFKIVMSLILSSTLSRLATFLNLITLPSPSEAQICLIHETAWT